jgi:hypothetical protein
MVEALLVAIACAVGAASAAPAKPGPSAHTAVTETPDLSAISGAICPIVYPVDESPAAKGYQYIFYDNAFFISREGYLVTAAHVLHSFKNGGQPYILVARSEAPPKC